jgi:hypothetical protein
MKSSSNTSSPAQKPPTDLPESLRPALAVLLEAYEAAQSVGRKVWDFAVEIATVRAKGLSNSDLRRLVCQGYVEHARETTPAQSGRRRTFRGENQLSFCARTCLVLTDAGAAAAGAGAAARQRRRRVPHYHPKTGVWRLGRRIIKKFKQPALTQRCVLEREQALGWPEWTSDPLPPDPEIDPRRHLHDTLKNLNNNQRNELVRFFGDGTGRGICWKFVRNGKRG